MYQRLCPRTSGIVSACRQSAPVVALIAVALGLGFQITRAASLTSIAPAGASAGVIINVTGTGFDPAAANNDVVFTPTSGPAITVRATAIAVVDTAAGLRRLSVTVPASLPVGTVAVQVVNRISGELSDSRPFDVVSLHLPEVASAAPGAANVSVRVTGSPNSRFTQGTTRATFGAGVTVHSTTVQSASSLVANVSVSSSAAIGLRDVIVLSTTQTARLAGGFSIQTTPPANRAPTANAGGPYNGTVGQPVAFSGSGTDPDNDPLSFSWNFGDGTPAATGATPSHTYAQAGDFTVTLTVSDGRGGTTSGTATAHIVPTPPVNQPPTANAGGPYNGTVGQAVAFSGSGTDPDSDPLTFSWNFGDGTPAATGPTPSHTYAQAGDFTVTLTVSDGRGGTTSATATAHIVPTPPVNQPPTANAGGPYNGTVGQPVAFSGSGTDPDNDPLTFSWNFGDGTAAATGATPSHTYAQVGDFTVTLTVSDGRGGTTTATVTAHIVPTAPVNQPPTANAGGPYNGTAGQPVAFSGSGADPDNDPLTFSWNFGDGTPAVTGATPSHTYAQAGDFTVTLTVNDGRGGTATGTATAHVVQTNAPPGFTSTPGTAGSHQVPYRYQATASDPNNDPLTFSLSQGPAGMTVHPDTGLVEWTPTGSQMGSQTVVLRVTDPAQASATQSFEIVVVDATPPVVTLSFPAEVLPGALVTAVALAADNIAVASVTIEVNGANPIDLPAAPFERSIPVPSSAVAGTEYHVRATARDAAGNVGTADRTFKVAALPDTQPPTLTLHAANRAAAGTTLRLTASAFDLVGVKSVTFKVGDTILNADPETPYRVRARSPRAPPSARPSASARARSISATTSPTRLRRC